MTSTTAIGRHRASRIGDLMRMTVDGPVSRADAEAMRVMMEATLAEHTRCFLVADMSGCAGIDAEARKYMAEWSRDGELVLSGIAAYGLSFTVRTIVVLTMSAIKFIGMHRAPVVFVKDEAEALSWVAGQREALAGGGTKRRA